MKGAWLYITKAPDGMVTLPVLKHIRVWVVNTYKLQQKSNLQQNTNKKQTSI
jgi:hypothetical protein